MTTVFCLSAKVLSLQSKNRALQAENSQLHKRINELTGLLSYGST